MNEKRKKTIQLVVCILVMVLLWVLAFKFSDDVYRITKNVRCFSVLFLGILIILLTYLEKYNNVCLALTVLWLVGFGIFVINYETDNYYFMLFYFVALFIVLLLCDVAIRLLSSWAKRIKLWWKSNSKK